MQKAGVLFALMLLVLALPVRGDAAAGPGLDLLLLVDRSGSMSSHSPPAIVDALPLALNVLAWSSRSARVNHRFGVISFGSRAHVDVPLTLVDVDTLPLLRTLLSTLPSRSLGSTNFAAPFESAAKALSSLPADPRRRRAILVLTDGYSDTPGVDPRAVRRTIEDVAASTLRDPPVSVDVLLFGNGEPEPWTKLTNSRIHRVQGDRGDLLAALHGVVGDLVGARNTEQIIAGAADVLVLPPYLELAVFDIVRGGAHQSVTVVPPGSSQPIGARTPGVEEMRSGDLMSTIIVRRPAPGAWVFRKSAPAARVTVLSQQFFPRGALVQPSAAPAVQLHDRVRIGYRLEDGEGRPLQEELGYPLSVDVSLASPDGRRVVLPMTRDPGSQAAVYRTTLAACDLAGRYWTEVLVTTADSNGTPVRVFEDRWSGFTVSAEQRRAMRATVMPARLRPCDDRSRAVKHLPAIALLTVSVLVAVLIFFWRR